MSKLKKVKNRFMAKADGRWAMVATEDRGWWGDEAGYRLALREIRLPEWHEENQLEEIWVGEDRALVDLRVMHDYEVNSEMMFQLDHASLLAYLDQLPRPLESFGAVKLSASVG